MAFSNEVFELWLLLHLADVAAELLLPRQEVYRQLGEAVRQHEAYRGYAYNHQQAAGAVIISIVQQIGNEALAVRRAEVLLAGHHGKSLLDTNPSTRVHLLVQSLRSWISYFGYQP